MVLPLRTGVENSAIRKCSYLYDDVNPAQEVHDVEDEPRGGGGGAGGLAELADEDLLSAAVDAAEE